MSRYRTMSSALVLLLAALLTTFVARKVRTYYALRQFGGHWSAGWSRLWLYQAQSSGEMNKIFTEINREHGKRFLSRFPTMLGSHVNVDVVHTIQSFSMERNLFPTPSHMMHDPFGCCRKPLLRDGYTMFGTDLDD